MQPTTQHTANTKRPFYFSAANYDTAKYGQLKAYAHTLDAAIEDLKQRGFKDFAPVADPNPGTYEQRKADFKTKTFVLTVTETKNKAGKYSYVVTDNTGKVITTRKSNRVYVGVILTTFDYYNIGEAGFCGREDLLIKSLTTGDVGNLVKWATECGGASAIARLAAPEPSTPSRSNDLPEWFGEPTPEPVKNYEVTLKGVGPGRPERFRLFVDGVEIAEIGANPQLTGWYFRDRLRSEAYKTADRVISDRDFNYGSSGTAAGLFTLTVNL